MIVMPAIPERHQRDKDIVSALIGGRKATRAKTVTERIGRPNAVIHTYRAHYAAPDYQLKAAGRGQGLDVAPRLADGVEQERISEDADIAVTLQHLQLGAAGEVAYEPMTNRHTPWGKKPSHVAPEETPLRRMRVSFSIRKSVVMPVMPYPPEWTILAGENTEKHEKKLEEASGLE